jgi:hypothetical protein
LVAPTTAPAMEFAMKLLECATAKEELDQLVLVVIIPALITAAVVVSASMECANAFLLTLDLTVLKSTTLVVLIMIHVENAILHLLI